MYDLCTYFDRNYLHRGLALYKSLLTNSKSEFTLWVLCLDNDTFKILTDLKYKGIAPIRLEDIEDDDPQLAAAKSNRSKIEYFWTLSPVFPLYLFRKNPDISKLLYVDSDMYFFSEPDPIFEELGDDSILIVPHDYSSEYKNRECSAGKYNVGTLVFRADKNGLLCLNWWRERCLEWCYARCEDGKFGDQGYLNDWPDRFEGVVISEKIGVRAAPWNMSKYGISMNGDHQLLVEKEPLICYHFHAICFCTTWLVFLASWSINMSREWRNLIYKPYIQELKAVGVGLAAEGYNLPLPTTGFPWRYIGGRILKRQPLRHFMIVNARR